MELNIHNITGIELQQLNTFSQEDGEVFYSRRVVIKTTKGDFTIAGFSDNGHNLLIDDPVLDDIKKPFELKAA